MLSGTVDVPGTPARLLADWKKGYFCSVGPGTRRRRGTAFTSSAGALADYASVCRQCRLDTPARAAEVLAFSDVALMACRGARYHHDGAQYGGAAFCNLFLSEDRGLDLHFPATGHRIPLTRGTVVIFDTGQPHAVIERRSGGFDAADFPPDQDCTQVFLTWELPIENAHVGRALRIAFDIDPSTSLQLDEEQVWLNGARGQCKSGILVGGTRLTKRQ